MIDRFVNYSIFSETTLSQMAEKMMINSLLREDFLTVTEVIPRQLASYAMAQDVEKSRIIVDLMGRLWANPNAKNLFPVFRDFDGILTSLGMKNHFIHQFEVFIFGWFIIRCLSKSGSNIEKLFKCSGVNEIFQTWLLASTAHDFGYPLQHVKTILREFNKLYQKLGMANVASKYKTLSGDSLLDETGSMVSRAEKICMRAGISLDMKQIFIDGLQEALSVDSSTAQRVLKEIEEGRNDRGERNHGYVSAIILFTTYLKYLCSSGRFEPDTLKVPQLRAALTAILLHNMPLSMEPYMNMMDIRCNAFAYILFLADNLQEWTRNQRPDEFYPSYVLYDISNENKMLKISVILTHEKWTRPMELKTIEDIKEKKRKLEALKKTNPSIGLQIHVSFETNGSISLKPVDITL